MDLKPAGQSTGLLKASLRRCGWDPGGILGFRCCHHPVGEPPEQYSLALNNRNAAPIESGCNDFSGSKQVPASRKLVIAGCTSVLSTRTITDFAPHGQPLPWLPRAPGPKHVLRGLWTRVHLFTVLPLSQDRLCNKSSIAIDYSQQLQLRSQRSAKSSTSGVGENPLRPLLLASLRSCSAPCNGQQHQCLACQLQKVVKLRSSH